MKRCCQVFGIISTKSKNRFCTGPKVDIFPRNVTTLLQICFAFVLDVSLNIGQNLYISLLHNNQTYHVCVYFTECRFCWWFFKVLVFCIKCCLLEFLWNKVRQDNSKCAQ